MTDNNWKNLLEEDLKSELIKDPDNSDLNVLSGIFLGKSTDEKMIRVYTKLDLSQYFRVPKDRILDAKRFPSGKIAVWIPGDLKIKLVTSDTLSGDFLKGSLQSANARRGSNTSILGSILGTNGPIGGTSFGCPLSDGQPICDTRTVFPNTCGCGGPSGCTC